MAELRKELSLYGLTMIAVGCSVGSGIFLTPGQIAANVESPYWILIAWTLGGLVALAGALTFAELAGMFPQAGGIYVFLREAFGGLFAFLYGWVNLFVLTAGAIAALSIACADHIGKLVGLNDTGVMIAAVAIILIVTIVNILGVKLAELFGSFFTTIKLIGIAAIVVIGLWLGSSESITNFQPSEKFIALQGLDMISVIGLALIGVWWSYGGFQHASFLAGETKKAQTIVPRAMILGAIIVGTVYLLTNLAYLFLLSPAELAVSKTVAADAIGKVLPGAGTAIVLIIIISTFGTAGIYTTTGPRLYYSMGRDGVFFGRLAKIHEQYKTPVFAILLQSVWAVILLLFWGTFVNLIIYVVFTDLVFLALAATSIIYFRLKTPEKLRPYRTLGFPITPILFISVAGVVVVNTIWSTPIHALVGLVVLSIGIPFYFYFRSSNS